jgi:hypothetical protein
VLGHVGTFLRCFLVESTVQAPLISTHTHCGPCFNFRRPPPPRLAAGTPPPLSSAAQCVVPHHRPPHPSHFGCRGRMPPPIPLLLSLRSGTRKPPLPTLHVWNRSLRSTSTPPSSLPGANCPSPVTGVHRSSPIWIKMTSPPLLSSVSTTPLRSSFEVSSCLTSVCPLWSCRTHQSHSSPTGDCTTVETSSHPWDHAASP